MAHDDAHHHNSQKSLMGHLHATGFSILYKKITSLVQYRKAGDESNIKIFYCCCNEINYKSIIE